MSQKKYYVVKVGKVPGIYETWAQTQEQVTKFPNAQYKAFATKDEALDYLNSDFTVEKQDSTNDAIDLEIDNLTDQEVLAFVDGSYTKDSKQQEKYSFGVVLITTKANDYLSRGFENPDYVKFRNVAGEIEGAKEAILWALTNQKSKIKIFHDYEGIAKWPNKEWDAKTEITRNYVDFYEQKKDLIDIQFAHVKSHSGVIFNEEADQLAKNALKSQSYKLHNLTTIYFENVDKETWISLIRDENNWLNSNEIPRISQEQNEIDQLVISNKSEKVIIQCDEDGNSYISGPNSFLYEQIITLGIQKIVSTREILQTLNSYYLLNIKLDIIEKRFKNLLKNFKFNKNEHKNDRKNFRNLIQACFYSLANVYAPNYTIWLFPLLYISKYYLERILGNKWQNEYFVQNYENGKYQLSNYKNKFNESQISFLNNLYNEYQKLNDFYQSQKKINEIKFVCERIINYLTLINQFYELFENH
ncbi:hypothetical protein C4M97_00360 [Mycoplasmopsis pullorum]|uniref:ribonuclease H1 domain-containing protein n=2 Tax=Mycoplasmopsis pullorum TaxID=48003 RepID=UPI00111AD6C0|nr:ribonuclease H family protein [Mycoplasmopsis pullorum]TNK82906.1 hypothetical protein C4M80_01985 [Mycoplasmopsis pullorum]TNK87114.1 hypothetical protein C4M82_00730 [Mycoplasmopsis pullorum]TNK89575.1 hypothetical protein C4M97_00360 [Mycoplasmopsis pullorum]TNK93190.1 hypothetical protein C4M83_00865 [Mycoplasmopsis pullorum]